jgi:hypothetical protein
VGYSALPIGEGKHGRLTPTKKINTIKNCMRHWKSYPLMSDQCVAGIQSKEDWTGKKVA